jgi:hypothetical protein
MTWFFFIEFIIIIVLTEESDWCALILDAAYVNSKTNKTYNNNETRQKYVAYAT